jgi:hypothetical protein
MKNIAMRVSAAFLLLILGACATKTASDGNSHKSELNGRPLEKS